MNNKQLVSLFFGLGFLVLVAGIFATTSMTPNTNNNGVEPQTINRTTNNNGNIGNAINENMPTTNEMADKIKTELSKVDGVTNVDASVANKCALVSCTVSENLRNTPDFKTTLSNKVKEINPNLTMVYIMESQDMMNTDLNDVKNKFTTLDTSSFQNFWNDLTNDTKNMVNR
ncbi:MAG: hypothetical protein E7314_00580 [Clostridiales bacterium]|nr:hypothetical protein [Clostridiales bacterium]